MGLAVNMEDIPLGKAYISGISIIPQVKCRGMSIVVGGPTGDGEEDSFHESLRWLKQPQDRSVVVEVFNEEVLDPHG